MAVIAREGCRGKGTIAGDMEFVRWESKARLLQTDDVGGVRDDGGLKKGLFIGYGAAVPRVDFKMSI